MSEEMLNRQCGQWRLDREIGQGAYGVVYLAVGPFKTGWESHVEHMTRQALEDFEKGKNDLNDSLKSLKNDLQTLPQ